jgi:hypothetical protein
MTKSALVKIGVPAQQASNMRVLRQVRQALDQGDAAIARVQASVQERIRVMLAGDDAIGPEPESEQVSAEGAQEQAH